MKQNPLASRYGCWIEAKLLFKQVVKAVKARGEGHLDGFSRLRPAAESSLPRRVVNVAELPPNQGLQGGEQSTGGFVGEIPEYVSRNPECSAKVRFHLVWFIRGQGRCQILPSGVDELIRDHKLCRAKNPSALVVSQALGQGEHTLDVVYN